MGPRRMEAAHAVGRAVLPRHALLLHVVEGLPRPPRRRRPPAWRREGETKGKALEYGGFNGTPTGTPPFI